MTYFNCTKSYLISLVGDDYDFFIKWAFGNKFNESIMLDKIPKLWNELHPDNKIHGDFTIKESIEMTVELWKKHSEFTEKC